MKQTAQVDAVEREREREEREATETAEASGEEDAGSQHEGEEEEDVEEEEEEQEELDSDVEAGSEEAEDDSESASLWEEAIEALSDDQLSSGTLRDFSVRSWLVLLISHENSARCLYPRRGCLLSKTPSRGRKVGLC